jgi:hypothetical protein
VSSKGGLSSSRRRTRCCASSCSGWKKPWPAHSCPIEWGLTGSEARVFGCLLERENASKDAIMATLYRDDGRDEAEIKIVDVFICKIRKKVRPFGIEITTLWGAGYAMPPPRRRQPGRRSPRRVRSWWRHAPPPPADPPDEGQGRGPQVRARKSRIFPRALHDLVRRRPGLHGRAAGRRADRGRLAWIRHAGAATS